VHYYILLGHADWAMFWSLAIFCLPSCWVLPWIFHAPAETAANFRGLTRLQLALISGSQASFDKATCTTSLAAAKD
jgi:hypothetical protein